MRTAAVQEKSIRFITVIYIMQIFYHHIGKEIYVFARFSPADM